MASANITTSGGLLSDDFIEVLREENCSHPAVGPGTFTQAETGTAKRIEADIALAYDLLRARYEPLRQRLGELDISDLRKHWLLPILRDLGFEPVYLSANLKVGDGNDAPSFNFSHRGWNNNDAPIINSIPWTQDFDKRPPKPRGSKSPHDELQSYLNLSNQHLWAMLTDGGRFRLLRDFHQTLTKGYVEIDLAGILESGDLGDFRAFYRLAHSSRFIARDGARCPLEQFKDDSQQTGVEVGKRLSKQVHAAIECLGNSFLKTDPELLNRLRDSDEASHGYYNEILRLIYRLLFLFFVEQRGWIPNGIQVYWDSYSVSMLRDRSLDPYASRDDHCDLWEGLKSTFHLVRNGLTIDGHEIPAYGGQLFNDDLIPTLLGKSASNADLLAAIRLLSFFEHKKVAQRINYARLEIDSLGSVYEGLLEYAPRVLPADEEIDGVQRRAGEFVLDPRSLARKTSGSHYTHRSLVQELIESALRPVIRERLKNCKTAKEREAAILSLKVCDDAVGSGAFVLAAMDAMGMELARVRIGEESDPTDEQLRQARRDVLQHCIYGVDLNPMAVELCKVTLWIHAAMPKMPLTFLDHRIRCGNSLIGVPTAQMVKAVKDQLAKRREQIAEEILAKESEFKTAKGISGEKASTDAKSLAAEIRKLKAEAGEEYVGWPDAIPDQAFAPVTGDHPETARLVAKNNRKQREEGKHQLPLSYMIAREQALDTYKKFEALREETVADVDQKAEAYRRWREQLDKSPDHQLADFWTAAFFWRHDEGLLIAPTQGLFDALKEGRNVEPALISEVGRLAAQHRFFHWHLEFPDVFEQGGFDCLLGNPPWERIKLQEEEHFSDVPYIAEAPNKAQRGKRIEEWRVSDDLDKQERIKRFDNACHYAEAESKFIRASERFPLTATGDINTYALFAELSRLLVSPTGRTGIIVPTGIATDDSMKRFFNDLLFCGRLCSLIGFINSKKIFQAVKDYIKFGLLTLGESSQADFAFNLTDAEQVSDPIRRFRLTAHDFALLNPNTRTCPVFRTRADADLTRRIYQRVPVLMNERTNESPWGVGFLRMLDMSNDSGLFVSAAGPDLLPVYEAKMMYNFDHRFGTYENATIHHIAEGNLPQFTPDMHADPEHFAQPRYWVAQGEVASRLPPSGGRRWFIAFRDITGNASERTAIFSILPYAGVGNSAPLLLTPVADTRLVACLFGGLTSLVFDYVARQKIAGAHMNFFFVKQLPVPPPSAYQPTDIEFVAPRVLELVYTAHDVRPFAESMGYRGDPFRWDESRRAVVRAELDAYYARLYGLTRDELRYILDPADVYGQDFPGETFRILKEKEVRQYGEFRTKILVLSAYDEIEKAVKAGKPFLSSLNPQPGDPKAAHS